MSTETRVLVECRLPDRASGGWYSTFNIGLPLQDLRLDAEGRIWKRWVDIAAEPTSAWEPCTDLDGLLYLQPDDPRGTRLHRPAQG